MLNPIRIPGGSGDGAQRITGQAPRPTPHDPSSRPPLIARLAGDTGEGSGRSCITLLHAPAGYGKTGAATRWLRDEAEAHPHVHWFRCSPRSASDFWKALADDLCAVAGAQGGTGQESTEPVGTNGEHPGAPTIGPEAVAGILQRLDAPLTLVIDDYHHATSGENDLALAELSAAMPDLALVAIGRRLVLLDGPLVASRTRVRGFGPHDLELTDDQIRRISERSELRDHPRLPEALERAGGWPLAVRVALDRLPRDSAGADPEPPRTADPRNPLDNLAHFTLQHLEIIGESARRILLAASQLDAISIDQAAEFVGSDPAATRQAVYELLELGVLEPVVAGDRSEFRCHTAVRTTLAARSERSFSPAQRESLMRGRADRIKETAPFTAFELFCSADCYADAESLLARFFTTITDETASCARILAALPETALAAHPTFVAARLMLELPNPSVSPATLTHLLGIWVHGLQLRFERQTRTQPDPLRLPLLAQSMVCARLRGRIDEAASLAERLEAHLGSVTPGSPAEVYRGSLPMYYREVATTALMVGDFTRARRNCERLREHSEALIAAPWPGFSAASGRTVSDPESGRRWLITALGELAFTDALDGDMRRAEELIAESAAITSETGTTAPGLAWVEGEIVRAHLSYEADRPQLLGDAAERMTPLKDRIEQWALLLIAETSTEHRRRGPTWALSHLRAGLADPGTKMQPTTRWRNYLVTFQTMLHTVLGDFTASKELLASLPDDFTFAQIEHARLALFSGDDVEALLLAQSIGNAGATKRQQLHRCLIATVAAWGCERQDEAFISIGNAARLLQSHGTPSLLWSVPFEPLREAALAAREAGVCDIVDTVDAIPEPARCRRYERLTEMELRTLEAIAEHRSAGQAATALFITPGTVKKHLAAVYRKLQAKGRDEAILQAARMGLLSGRAPVT